MEQLSVLEKKLSALIESKKHDLGKIQELSFEIEQLKEENAQLREQLDARQKSSEVELQQARDENVSLRSQIEKLEDSLLVRHQNIEAMNQERELAKMAVEDLIKDIDSIVGSEQQQ
jgi:chromosome segregation ATPase